MSALDELSLHIAHDPCRESDRWPQGAVMVGQDVRIVLRMDDAGSRAVSEARVVVSEGNDERFVGLERCDEGYAVVLSFKREPHVAFYRFEITLEDGGDASYAPREDSRATLGGLFGAVGNGICGFQVTVYEPAFSTPSWFAGAVMYQVFPDRYSRGSNGVRTEGLDYHRSMHRPVHMSETWDKPQTWWKGKGYDPVEFYGGTLQGIREKLGYLESLGVEALYLNPVFEARSYHRYDTADYAQVDPLLGTNDELQDLVSAAHDHGIRVILDAVLSHTGSDSRYFNAERAYAEPGAMQGPGSPYHCWYDFSPQEGGAPYRCWWGDPSLPEVDEHNESWQEHVFGLLERWLAAGIDGYRLDVADELPDDVLERIRSVVKAANREAVIIGEVWEDPTTKESYGTARTYALGRALDSVMNYPLREALLGFATGASDAQQLATFLRLQQSNYPEPLYNSLMNLISSHDVERVRSYLCHGGPFRNEPRERQEAIVMMSDRGADERAAKRQGMVAGLLYALPGAPCLYYGDERGMRGGSDPFCRAPMVWDDPHNRPDYGIDLTERYRSLGMMRKRSTALRNGSMQCAALDRDALCIVRSASEELVVAIANRREDARKLVVDLRALKVDARRELADMEDGLLTVAVPASETVFVRL